MTLLEILQLAVTAALVFVFAGQLRAGRVRRYWLVFLRHPAREWVWMLVSCLAMIVLTIGLGWALMVAIPPVMGFSWLRLLATPEEAPRAATNLAAAGAKIPYFGIAFLALLLLNVPWLARREEEIFRRGTQGFGDAAVRCLKFGFVHAFIGVPVGFCLALAVAGAWFTWHYRKGGIRRASRYHALYNLMLLCLLGAALIGRT
jgi:hypothetical protein